MTARIHLYQPSDKDPPGTVAVLHVYEGTDCVVREPLDRKRAALAHVQLAELIARYLRKS